MIKITIAIFALLLTFTVKANTHEIQKVYTKTRIIYVCGTPAKLSARRKTVNDIITQLGNFAPVKSNELKGHKLVMFDSEIEAIGIDSCYLIIIGKYRAVLKPAEATEYKPIEKK